uniref:ATP-grasp domain-containing protein n=1 Tax=Chromera velia CCMP2878 TaxID=1169474 RepID=A0A0G4HTS4_9ALVE|eukprot:Cvel_31541.t1-p1 / transcript=Cvel_31541.t1 / gene=Cvel_31541 / organism=Chromera_velia_CCMP2878 / gene_product=hypothetical protein / transcript_product=hypothetical protein / location=Cvel_scaffold4716:2469-3740(-) / protein_length=424 / sequence_SO=supercontig / SO=protein_coding / is_pseudo=false
MASLDARLIPLNAPEADADTEAGQGVRQTPNKMNSMMKKYGAYLPIPSWALCVVGALTLLSVYCLLTPASVPSYAPTITVLGVEDWHCLGNGQDCAKESKLTAAKIKLITPSKIDDPSLKEIVENLGVEESPKQIKSLDDFMKKNNVDLVTFGMAESKIAQMLKLRTGGWPLSAPMTSQGMLGSADFYRMEDKDQFQQTLKDTGLEDFTIKNYDASSLIICKDMPTPKSDATVADRCSLTQTVDYPLMIKPSQGRGAISKNHLYKKVDSAEELLKFFNTPLPEKGGKTFLFLSPADFTLQEWVVSKYEDSFHFVYSEDHGGFLKVKITRDEYKTDDAVAHHNPERTRTTLERDDIPPFLMTKFGQFLKMMQYRGIGCFDMKYRNSDLSKPMVMEMNPRICGSQPDFPDYGDWFRTWARLYVVKE